MREEPLGPLCRVGLVEAIGAVRVRHDRRGGLSGAAGPEVGGEAVAEIPEAELAGEAPAGLAGAIRLG